MHKIGTSERPDWSLAVVIGAGGLGAATARRLSQRHRVLVVDIDAERAERTADALRHEGGDATGVACDITDPTAVSSLVERVREHRGFRVLAHVAGLSPSAGDFRSILTVNLIGAVAVAAGLLPLAEPGAAGILISSLAAHNFRPAADVEDLLRRPDAANLVDALIAALGEEQATPQMAYVLSKYALMAYCRRQAVAWGERSARIVSLSPGLIATPMGAREFANSPTKIRLYEKSPLKREGTMLEICDAIEFLASDKASFISGTDLLVDGGLAGALAG